MQLKLPILLGAISEIKINQALIRYAFFLSHALEIFDSIFVQADSNLLFQFLSVGIGSRVGKIVVFTHDDALHKFRVLACLLYVLKLHELSHSFLCSGRLPIILSGYLCLEE